MPIYSDPRHGVRLSEAQLEAAAIAPLRRPILHTLELYHPTGTAGEAIYLVRDKRNLLARKEAGAERDAGLEVEFIACSIETEPATESDSDSLGEVQLKVGNVGGVMSDALRRARGSLEPWECIERVFAADDTSGPAQLPPARRLLSKVGIAADVVLATAGYGDPANTSIPSTTFKRTEHPGLVR